MYTLSTSCPPPAGPPHRIRHDAELAEHALDVRARLAVVGIERDDQAHEPRALPRADLDHADRRQHAAGDEARAERRD
jgi:hypothetical protein